MSALNLDTRAVAWSGVGGLVVVFAALAAARGLPDVPFSNIVLAVAGFALFLACEVVLIVRNYTCNRSPAEEHSALRTWASKRQARENFAGVMVMGAGFLMQASHSMFGAQEFAGEWAVSFALGFIGMGLQIFAQARYIKTVG